MKKSEILEIEKYQIPYFLIGNKIDEVRETNLKDLPNLIGISALKKENLDILEQKLIGHFHLQNIQQNQVIVTNLRHYESLQNTLNALLQVQESLQMRLSTEMVASDIREAIYHLGSIVGVVTHEDLLDFIFSKFCIGK